MHVETASQHCPTGEFRRKGWARTVTQKFDVLLRATEEHWGGVFAFSDVDIQFFDLDASQLVDLLGGRDVVFQRNSSREDVCTGFFVCRANEVMRNFWKVAKNQVHECMENWADQEIADFLLGITPRRHMLIQYIRSRQFWRESNEKARILAGCLSIFFRQRCTTVSYGLLPDTFYLPGALWGPGQPLSIPQGICLHHANWTAGIQNKIAQLEYVKRVVADRASESL